MSQSKNEIAPQNESLQIDKLQKMAKALLKELEVDIQETNEPDMITRSARGSMEVLETPDGFIVESWGEKTPVKWNKNGFYIDTIPTLFSLEKEEPLNIQTTKMVPIFTIYDSLMKSLNTDSHKEVIPTLKKVLHFTHILNFIKHHSKAVIQQRKTDHFTLYFAESIQDIISERKGIVYKFSTKNESYIATLLSQGKKEKSEKETASFYYFCPTQAQRQAVIKYLNGHIEKWRKEIPFRSK